jgi:hypothetical protein
MRIPWAAFFFFLVVGFVSGCSQSASQGLDMGSEDGKQIAELVEQLNDDGGRAKKAKEIFAAGGKESKNYGIFRYDLKGKPSVSGTTATATILIEKLAGGDAPTEKQWEFVKEGDKWKIKSAPLP